MAIITSEIQEIDETKMAAADARWDFTIWKKYNLNRKKHQILMIMTYPLVMFIYCSRECHQAYLRKDSENTEMLKTIF